MHDDLARAKETLAAEGHTCVLCRGPETRTSDQRGVRPLLDWLDGAVDCRGFSAADKVVGNGAAYLYVLLEVRAVHANVMSEPAMATLAAHGVDATCDQLVPAIQNRDRTGFCPIEKAVASISPDRPQDAPAAIRARLAELASKR